MTGEGTVLALRQGLARVQGMGEADFPYPTFPFTTLSLMETHSQAVVTGFGATVSDIAASDSPYGLSTALQYTARSDGGATTVSGAALGAGVDVTGNGSCGTIRVAFKPVANYQNNNNTMATFELRLYSAGLPSSPGANYHLYNLKGNVPWLSTSPAAGTPGRWQYFGAPVSKFSAVGSGADLTSVKYALLNMQGATVVLWLGNIDFVPNPRTKAAMIFRIDDCPESAYSIAYPALAAVGAGGYFQPGDVNSTQGLNGAGRVTDAQLAEMLAHGWQAGSASSTTEDNTVIDGMTSAQRTAEFAAARAYGTRFGRYRDTNDGAFFSNVGITDMTAWPEIHANRRTLQGFFSGSPTNPPLPEGEAFPFPDPYLVRALNIESPGGSGSAKTTYVGYQIAAAVAVKGVIILACHDDLNTDPNALQAFNDAIAYAQANPSLIEITTLRALLAPYNGDTLVG